MSPELLVPEIIQDGLTVNYHYSAPPEGYIFDGEHVLTPTHTDTSFELFTRSATWENNQFTKDVNRCLVLVLLGQAAKKGMTGQLSLMYHIQPGFFSKDPSKRHAYTAELRNLMPFFRNYTQPNSREALIAGGIVFNNDYPTERSHHILKAFVNEELGIQNPHILPPKLTEGSTEVYVRTQERTIDVFNFK